MRLSFVQRLKNQKHDTVPTRESQQKSNSYSIKAKSHSVKHQTLKGDTSQHCDDIKRLLSILEETKNPQFDLNTQKINTKTKTQQKKQIYHDLSIVRKQKKEHSVKSMRPTSGSYLRQDKFPFEPVSKKFDENDFLNFEIKVQQNRHKNSLPDVNGINCMTNKLMPYRFPGKRRLQSTGIILPPIEISKRPRQPRQLQSTISEAVIIQKDCKKIGPSLQGKRGLQNMGNTCYINSIVQCLFHLSSFNSFFSDRKYLMQEKIERQKFNSDRSIVEKYRQLYLYVMKGDSEAKKSTYSLKLALSKSCSLFLDWEQEDAHEFMRKLLDSMHQEINRSSVPSPYKLLNTRTKLKYSSISSLADEYFQYYKQKDDSYIYDCFGGQLYNNIQCVKCNSKSITFENCLDISLALVKGKTNLNELLEEFFGEEKLCDYYTCDYCGNTNKNSIKTTKFWRTPEILIVQLKRSQFGKKNLEPITFPVDVLNLQNYINNQNDKISQKYASYTLKSVICHRGASEGGHYWSIVKEYGQWYEIDDDKVNKLESTNVKRLFETTGSGEGYILFYQSMNR